MQWGWSGHNSSLSIALLNGPTTATSRMEREYLQRAASELTAKTKKGSQALSHAALPFVLSEYLADYKAYADAELQAEFAHFISGNNTQFLDPKQRGGGKYTNVPFVMPWDTVLCEDQVGVKRCSISSHSRRSLGATAACCISQVRTRS